MALTARTFAAILRLAEGRQAGSECDEHRVERREARDLPTRRAGAACAGTKRGGETTRTGVGRCATGSREAEVRLRGDEGDRLRLAGAWPLVPASVRHRLSGGGHSRVSLLARLGRARQVG